MDDVAADEGWEYDGVVDPYFDIDCDPMQQTGSDWYALALTASLGGKPLHGFTFATTTETIGKTTFDYAAKHTVGWVKTNEPVMNVEQPGNEWDEVVRPTRLHTGVKTGSQLSLMFDTDSWESSSATRARNAAFLAAGMVTHGMPVSRACDIVGSIAGEEVPEAAVMNTVVPVSHLKREAAGVAKASHAIFSRMNAQRYISWQDTQLHEGILPHNASLDWAKVTVVARYIAEANIRYDSGFRKLARTVGVPYTIIKGSWAYVSNSDYLIDCKEWDYVRPPSTSLIRPGTLLESYAMHTERLTTQIMRTYNELASDERSLDLEAILKMAENMHKSRSKRTKIVSLDTDVLQGTVTHQQTASIAAANTATSATSFNAVSQAFNELVLSDRNLKHRATILVATRRRLDDMVGELVPFFPYLATRHTWTRALELLDSLIGNPRTSLDRINRLHRSMTQTSATIAVDVPLTARTKHAMAPHIVELLKRGLIRPGPTVALPRHVTSFKAAVERGSHARLLRAVGEHLATYRQQWADRYEDQARVYGESKVNRHLSVKYGAASAAFAGLSASTIVSEESGFIDGANVRASYLYKVADSYSRKRRLAKPKVPLTAVGDAYAYADILDSQYDAEVTFRSLVDFVQPRLKMFADDLKMDIEPRIPDEDYEIEENVADEEEEAALPDEFADLAGMGLDAEALAMLQELAGGDQPVFTVTEEKVLDTYGAEHSADAAARANGYSSFQEAYDSLKDGARFDTETEYTKTYLKTVGQEQLAEEGEGLAIA